jgi:hypothetical protein
MKRRIQVIFSIALAEVRGIYRGSSRCGCAPFHGRIGCLLVMLLKIVNIDQEAHHMKGLPKCFSHAGIERSAFLCATESPITEPLTHNIWSWISKWLDSLMSQGTCSIAYLHCPLSSLLERWVAFLFGLCRT